MTASELATAKAWHSDWQNADRTTQKRLARIVSVTGSQAVAILNAPRADEPHAQGERIEIGALMKIGTPNSSAIGVVSSVTCPLPESSGSHEGIELIELNLAGEIASDMQTGRRLFRRGVAGMPSVGDPVYSLSSEDLQLVYGQPEVATITVGRLYQNPNVEAHLRVDDLLGKHFLIVGTTGCGKSSATIGILQSVLEKYKFGHIVVLDMHNEYGSAFGEMAEQIDPASLRLPFWMMNFQELTAALTGDDEHKDREIEILSEAVQQSKRRYSESQHRLRRASDNIGISVDTPTPFRLSDVTAFIDERLGRLEKTQPILPLRRLKNRIETLISDPRFAFMFGSPVVEDNMSAILGRIFRIPVDGRPITVINLASVPPEILDIVISVISRLAFDFAVWSEGQMPMLLVCEEAHRYAPASTDQKFLPTRQSLARIAKEGRKYALALALITQRPSELDPTILSQCSTVVAMRLSTERDQQVVRANTHEGFVDLLDCLPLLADQEAIVLGQGVIMPVRIKFRNLESRKENGQKSGMFATAWRDPNINREILDSIVGFWRGTNRPDTRSD
jgi:DNA helicase HerA-like ATPase